MFERGAGFSYTLLGTAELARFSKQSKRKGAINYCISQSVFQPNSIGAVTNDGTFWLWNVNTTAAGPEVPTYARYSHCLLTSLSSLRS